MWPDSGEHPLVRNSAGSDSGLAQEQELKHQPLLPRPSLLKNLPHLWIILSPSSLCHFLLSRFLPVKVSDVCQLSVKKFVSRMQSLIGK